VAAAKDRGEFTEAEVARAASWDTCAVGEQRAARPLVVTVQWGTPWPADRTLRRLGYAFYQSLKANDAEDAAMILEAIQGRTRELERELST
jgi:hypothetical protein